MGGLNNTNASTPYEPPIKLGQPGAKTSDAGAMRERYDFSSFIRTACMAVVVVVLLMGL